ncbi:MAG: glutathione-disulfide reductase [Prochloron sp. SP5CPC1]|nr:glutathione-disulfide reductase [Candidatus Paraprochloron terpiosi SP5CPC1]
MSYDFDLMVIGAGSGGIAAARRAASYGARVGIGESGYLGGTCVNRGCIPKKLMVYSSRFPGQFTEAAGYGWHPVSSKLDWLKMMLAVNQEVERLNGIYENMLQKSGVEIIPGYGKFIDSHSIAVGERKITAEKILIAVGGRPVRPDNIPGIEHAIVSDDIFKLPIQPKKMVILGGGYIGVEFACIMQGLGTEVTLMIRSDKILRGFDEDLRTEIQTAMENHGIRILTNITSLEITQSRGGLEVKTGSQIVATDTVSLAATGRIPNLEGLALENGGVLVQNGAIVVDKYSRTNQEHIFAVGDCTDRINLTPVAINEGRALADTQFGGKSRTMAYDNIPSAIFTTPEGATVGLTEAEARNQYGEVKVYKSRFRPLYHTLTGRDEKTMMKLIVDSKTDKVLGAHMVGEHAAEIIQGVAIVLKMGGKKADFDATVGIHPTSAEEFVTMR